MAFAWKGAVCSLGVMSCPGRNSKQILLGHIKPHNRSLDSSWMCRCYSCLILASMLAKNCTGQVGQTLHFASNLLPAGVNTLGQPCVDVQQGSRRQLCVHSVAHSHTHVLSSPLHDAHGCLDRHRIQIRQLDFRDLLQGLSACRSAHALNLQHKYWLAGTLACTWWQQSERLQSHKAT